MTAAPHMPGTLRAAAALLCALAALGWLSAPAAAAPSCSDGEDFDFDGLTDYPFDPGCDGPEDEDETGPALACDDRVDADGDLGASAGIWGGNPNLALDPGCSDPFDPSESDPNLPCDDGLDNDGDGLADWAQDPGCEWPWSPSEAPACHDGLDNDADGAADFPDDPGCASAHAASEVAACENGVDDDGDGLADHPADPGCAAPDAPSEAPVCQDGLDNDGDGLIDHPHDPGCAGFADEAETDPAFPCDDGLDNDVDYLIDFPDDPGCADGADASELGGAPCDDGIDNDGDGVADRGDPACRTPHSPSESPACDDGIDNDGDGAVDRKDSACLVFWLDSERSACADGLDNDGDGLADFPLDPDCRSAADTAERHPDPGALVPLVDGLAVGGWVWVDRDGRSYTDSNDGLFRVAPDGSRTQLLGPQGDGAGHAASPSFGYSTAVDRQGTPHVAGFWSGNVFRISPSGAPELEVGPRGDGIRPLVQPRHVKAGADGNLYVAGLLGPVFRVTPSGAIQRVYDPQLDEPGPHEFIEDLSVGDDGTLWVAYSRRVVRVSPSGEVRQMLDAGGDGRGHPFLASPDSFVAAAPGGSAYAAGAAGPSVFRISADGSIEQVLDWRGDGAGNFLLGITSLDVDSGGTLWVHGALGDDPLFAVTPAGEVRAVSSGAQVYDWSWSPRAVIGWDDRVYVDTGAHTYRLDLGPACADGLDNDGDGLADFPQDPDCQNADDALEAPDSDGDGIADARDNCLAQPNPDQRDADLDGFGSACDADFDGDGLVGSADWLGFVSAFGRPAPPGSPFAAYDLDGDGAVGGSDFARLSQGWGQAPGPSGLACAGAPPCQQP
jgi:hypothetical protein